MINIGIVDRIIRVALGIALLAIVAIGGRYSVWGFLGLIPLATGVVGFDPLYSLLGVSTTRGGPRERHV